jgi:hypothetical protein
VLAAEQLLRLRRFHFARERLEALAQVALDVLALLRPLDEHGQIVLALLQRVDQLDLLLEATAALEGLLRLGLILPEIGQGRTLFEPGQFVGRV